MKTFELTERHIKLLKKFIITWDDSEFGAPAVDPKRPYGNSNVITDMLEILGIKHPETDTEIETDEETIQELILLHKELKTALQIVLITGEFKPGNYTCADYSYDWELRK